MSALSRFESSWIKSIKINGTSDEIEVKIDIPVDTPDGYARHVHLEDLERGTPAYLMDAARAFTQAVVRRVREFDGQPVKVMCDTCTGACCGRVYQDVHVTKADLARLGPELTGRGVDPFEQETWNGAVGTLRRVPWTGAGEVTFEADAEKLACIFLDPRTALCSIYTQRPGVCREYSGVDCDEHEQAPQKLVKLRQKVTSVTR